MAPRKKTKIIDNQEVCMNDSIKNTNDAEDSKDAKDEELKDTEDVEDSKRSKGKSQKKVEHALCPVILSKGKRKGLSCNRKIILDGETFCKFHMSKSVESQLCTIILTKGERKNKPCNRKVVEGSPLCKRHVALEEKRPYNPYIEKETDIQINDDLVTSSLQINKQTLEISKLNPDVVCTLGV